MAFKLIYILLLLIVSAAGAVYTFLTGKKGRDADMYLPGRLVAMGAAIMAAGIGAAIAAATRPADKYTVLLYIGGATLVVLGMAALLCWKNQKVYIISDTEFTYTTFLGHTFTYRFDEIEGLKRSRDSMKLILKYGKVHIESMAVLSERFQAKIVEALQQKSQA
ncbi:MAG: hypothetical protein IJ438_00380 [Clostridia bacterium]|nr:hypothetical protein [Clostridia bacterium]